MPSSIINSDDGVISGTSGLKTTGGDDGITNFQQNGTTQATITAAGLFQFNSGYGSVATAFGCRAWVNFNGTGVVAIRASGNVSSITDNGTGDYTVNFTTAMPDANYCVVAGASGRSTDTTPDAGVAVGVGATTVSGSVASGTRIVIGNPTTQEDSFIVTLAVFR